MSYDKLKILCDTTFDGFPDSSIENFVRDIVVEHEMLLDKIDRLYEGLSQYYNYTDNIEDVLCTLRLEDTVFGQMPPDSGEFTHKDCRFLLDEIKLFRGK